MKYNYLVILCISAFFSLSACADNGIAVPSSWVNTEGSILTISAIDSAGQITGSYVNKASGWNCQNIVYPVTGWIYVLPLPLIPNGRALRSPVIPLLHGRGFCIRARLIPFGISPKTALLARRKFCRAKIVLSRLARF